MDLLDRADLGDDDAVRTGVKYLLDPNLRRSEGVNSDDEEPDDHHGAHPPRLRHSGRGGVADVGAGDADDDRHAAAVRGEDVVLQLVGALRAAGGRLCAAVGWSRGGRTMVECSWSYQM